MPATKLGPIGPSSGVYSVKSVRFERLLASTAFGLVLALSSHPGLAQQSDKEIGAAVPVPNTDLLPPLTAKDIQTTPAAAPSAEPAKAAETPAAPAGADTQVADQLRDLITGKKLDRLVARRDDRAGVDQFYKARAYKPLWLADGKAGAQAKAAIAYLAQVDTVGLDPQDYPVPDFAAAVTPEDQAAAELKFTNSVLTYARNAQIGRIHFSRVGNDIDFKLNAP